MKKSTPKQRACTHDWEYPVCGMCGLYWKDLPKGNKTRKFLASRVAAHKEKKYQPTELPPLKTLHLSEADRLIIASSLLYFVESPLSKGLRKDARQLAEVFVPNWKQRFRT